MRKGYLLAGSLGLLGAITQIVPAQAANPSSSIQTAQPEAVEGLAPTTVTGIANSDPASTTFKASTPTSISTPQTLLVAKPEVNEPASAVAPVAPEAGSQTQVSGSGSTLIAQGAPVTSVSQLSDVQPSDWAFQALQSLIERYGCIAGYPDGTFRGNRALTRYEFAAGTYACLNSLAERLGTLSPEDLATIRRLQEEFAAELATLRGRVDGLEARTTELEENQFSTTTKLQGEAVFAAQYGEQDSEGRATALARVRLNFNTSFTGDDLLQTQLELGNGGEDLIANRTFLNNGDFLDAVGLGPGDDDFRAAPFPVDLGGLDYGIANATATDAALRRLAYSFSFFDDLVITVGPRLFPSDFVDTNSYANISSQDFSSGFFVNSPLIINNGIDVPGGAGAAIDWNFGGGPITVRAVYVAASPTNATPNTFGGGLFGDPYQATAEVEFSPSDVFAIRAQYTRSAVNDIQGDAYGANAELTLGDRFGIFGRYARGEYDTYGEASSAGIDDFKAQSFMGGVAIRDLLLPGSLLGVAYGRPFFGNDVEPGDGDPQENYEGFFRFALTDNITITPAVIVISNPNNGVGDDNTIYQGVLRTTFSF